MASEAELRAERIQKVSALQDQQGQSAFAVSANKAVSISTVLSDFDTYESSQENLWLHGRVMAKREHGSIAFLDLLDDTDSIQVYIRSDEVGEDVFNTILELVDLGDIIEVNGSIIKTKRGEPSIKLDSWNMLTKALLPLPEKWHGIKDEESRLRNRELDLLLSPELREMFKKKALFWQTTREFLINKDFIEVQTPTLEVTTGGAEARPFRTHHNDFDMDVFLRISVGELWQKRLMAAHLGRTFEIGRVYRNEGSSPEHLQEFTNCEFYASYVSFEDGKEMVKDLYKHIAEMVFGTTQFETRGHKFDLNDDWAEIDYVDTVNEMTGVDVLEATVDEMKAKLSELNVKFDGDNRERLMDSLWKYCRRQISGPAFLINHPKLVAPLSNEHPDDLRKTLTFQVILAGSEVGRAHSELNNPIDQRKRFEVQQKLLEAGDEEAMMPDWEYVRVMEQGIPPTFGFGFGERLFSFLVNKTIRETQLFPLLRDKKE